MKFFKLSDYARSWSVQALALLTTGAVVDHFTGIVTAIVPEDYKGIVVAVIGAVTMVLRAIKQENK